MHRRRRSLVRTYIRFEIRSAHAIRVSSRASVPAAPWDSNASYPRSAPPAARRPQLPVPARFMARPPPRRVHPPQWSQRPTTPVAVLPSPSAQPPTTPVTVQAPLTVQPPLVLPPQTPVGVHVLQFAQGIVAYVTGMLHVAYVAGLICLLFTAHGISCCNPRNSPDGNRW